METQPDQPQAPKSLSPLHCRVPFSATTPKLDQHPHSTNSTHHRYKKALPSYDHCRVEPNPFTLTLQVQTWATAVSLATPQIVSETGPRETNETQNSHKTLHLSYKRCLTHHPNRIWHGRFAETTMRRLVSTTPPNPVHRGYTPHPNPLPSRERELPPRCRSMPSDGHHRDQWRCYTVHISTRR